MRHITITVLSVLFALPAMAGAHLPVVNIASGGVSARSAFGEETSVSSRQVSVAPIAKATSERKVVARVATKTAPVASADVGEQIVASAEVLTPRRPSPDLWAKNDTALRMPRPEEFAVMRTDTLLPEESIDNTNRAVAYADVSSDMVVPAVPAINNQIARLNELQRRADDSMRNVSSRVIASPIADTPVVAARAPVAPTPVEPETVSVRRMVVPMADDVIVRRVEEKTSPLIAAVRDDMSQMTPAQLRQAFRKTFLSENKHLSTYSMDSRFDVDSDMTSNIEGFTARSDLSEGTGIRPLEIKIKFRNDDSSLSRDNYTLLTEYAGIVVNKPTRAIQVAIPQHMTQGSDARKLTARRLAIVEQVLTDNGVSQQRIVPVLSNRNETGFVLRIISGDEFESLTQRQHDIFGDTVGKKTYKSMTW